MLDPDFKKWLTRLLGSNVRFDEPMSRHTSFRVGGPADAYLTPETRGDLIRIMDECRHRKVRYTIIGGGTNLLVKDNGIRGIVIVLATCPGNMIQTDVRTDGTIIRAMAGARLASLCHFAVEHGFEGMNFALGIPGTVGGAMMMNAGTAYGSVEEVLESVDILLPSGQIIFLEKEDLNFDYRGIDMAQSLENVGVSVSDDEGEPAMLEARFRVRPSDPVKLRQAAKRILRTRKERQPTNLPSAGCFFKNPVPVLNRSTPVTREGRQQPRPAGRLIDLAGLKGKRIGGAEVSPKHANFIINREKASANDILALAKLIQKTVSKMFNVKLETEVKIIGE